MAKAAKKKAQKKPAKKAVQTGPSPLLPLLPLAKAALPYCLFFGFVIGSSLIAKAKIENLQGVGAESYSIGLVKGFSEVQGAHLQAAIQRALEASPNPYSPFSSDILPNVAEELGDIAGMKEVNHVRRLYSSEDGYLSAKLSLSFSWRQPWAQVKNRGTRYIWIDREGFCLPGATNFRDGDAPLITAQSGAFAKRNREELECNAPWQDAQLQKAISLLHYLQTPSLNVPFKVRDISVVYPSGARNRRGVERGTSKTSFTVHTVEGYGIRWGSYEAKDNSFEPHRRAEVLNTVRKLIAAHRGQLERVDYFDVSAIGGAETVSFK